MTTTLKALPTSYDEVRSLLPDYGIRVLIGPNTHARLNQFDSITISLHGKDIVLLHPTGDVSVKHCGWVTHTTFDRFNRFTRPIGWVCSRQGGRATAVGIHSGEETSIDADTWTLLGS